MAVERETNYDLQRLRQMTNAPTMLPSSGGMTEFFVECEIEAHDGPHQLQLLVVAPDEDDAIDRAIWMLDRGRVTSIWPKG